VPVPVVGVPPVTVHEYVCPLTTLATVYVSTEPAQTALDPPIPGGGKAFIVIASGAASLEQPVEVIVSFTLTVPPALEPHVTVIEVPVPPVGVPPVTVHEYVCPFTTVATLYVSTEPAQTALDPRITGVGKAFIVTASGAASLEQPVDVIVSFTLTVPPALEPHVTVIELPVPVVGVPPVTVHEYVCPLTTLVTVYVFTEPAQTALAPLITGVGKAFIVRFVPLSAPFTRGLLEITLIR